MSFRGRAAEPEDIGHRNVKFTTDFASYYGDITLQRQRRRRLRRSHGPPLGGLPGIGRLLRLDRRLNAPQAISVQPQPSHWIMASSVRSAGRRTPGEPQDSHPKPLRIA